MYLWRDESQFGDESDDGFFPIPPNEGEGLMKVTKPMNYFEGEMIQRSLGAAMMLIALSHYSFGTGVRAK